MHWLPEITVVFHFPTNLYSNNSLKGSAYWIHLNDSCQSNILCFFHFRWRWSENFLWPAEKIFFAWTPTCNWQFQWKQPNWTRRFWESLQRCPLRQHKGCCQTPYRLLQSWRRGCIPKRSSTYKRCSSQESIAVDRILYNLVREDPSLSIHAKSECCIPLKRYIQSLCFYPFFFLVFSKSLQL